MSTEENRATGKTDIVEFARKNATPGQSKRKLVVADDDSPSTSIITSLDHHIEGEDILDQFR